MVLWWIANAVALLIVVPLVVVLAQRVIRLVQEIARYGGDIRTHAGGIATALEPVPALAATRDHVATIKETAVAYVAALRVAARG
jgi:hypothetical protein